MFADVRASRGRRVCNSLLTSGKSYTRKRFRLARLRSVKVTALPRTENIHRYDGSIVQHFKKNFHRARIWNTDLICRQRCLSRRGDAFVHGFDVHAALQYSDNTERNRSGPQVWSLIRLSAAHTLRRATKPHFHSVCELPLASAQLVIDTLNDHY